MDMYFEKKRFAVFDIETTGLNPANCQVMLTGILRIDGSSCEAVQYFADSQKDEKELIEATLKELSSVDFVLTYNGRHFDLPFMQKRSAALGIEASSLPYTLDLYLILNGHSHLKTFLPDLKQKTVEKFMGLSQGRDDGISGGESVELYDRYLASRSPSLEKTILLHNHDDIIQLYRLLPVIEQTDFHKAMSALGFPVNDFIIKKIGFTGHDLHVSAVQTGKPVSYISFPTESHPYTLNMNQKSRSLDLTIPCFSEGGASVCDAAAILDGRTEKIEMFPNVVNGYLIAGNHSVTNYMEINALVIAFFNEIIPEIIQF